MALVKVAWPRDHRMAFSRQLQSVAEAALREIGEDALEKSNRIIPLEEGTLSDSGFVEVEKTRPGQIEGQVAYSTPYAVVQHEDPTLTHDPGREDHYLESTVHANSEAWEAHVARRLRNGLR